MDFVLFMMGLITGIVFGFLIGIAVARKVLKQKIEKMKLRKQTLK